MHADLLDEGYDGESTRQGGVFELGSRNGEV